MEKKNKFLRIAARVLAIVTALVCTLCMVVPSYAEETETETAQEQEGRLNAMVGADVFRATDHVVDLNYRDMQAYAVLDSNSFYVNTWYAITNVPVVAKNLGGYVYIKVYDQDGNLVDEYGQVVHQVSMNYPAGTSGFLRLTDTVSSVSLDVGTRRSSSTNLVTFKHLSIPNRTSAYYASDGYTYEGYCILNNVTPDNGMFYCFSDQIYNPSKMLGYSFAGDADEVYNQGYSAGYQFGFEEGEMHGLEEGMDIGREEGYTEGDADGYRRGYDDGMTQMSLIDLVTGILRAPMTLIESALNFDIFGINMSNAVKALVSMALLAVVITIVWKAVK